MARELLICVALPSVLLVCATAMAQNSDTPPQGSDQQIAEALNSKLTSYFGNPLTFSVGVQDGTVTLSGMIPSAEQRTRAEALVREVTGVTSVNDQLVVGTPPAAQPGTGPVPQESPPPQETQSNQDRQDQSAAPTASGAATQGDQSQSSFTPADSADGNLAPLPNAAPAQPAPVPYRSPEVTVSPGTPIYALMLQSFGSRHTKPGERFRSVLAQDIVLQNGAIAIPRGAFLDGTVVDARPPGHLKGRPKLALQLNDVEIGGRNYPLNSSIWAHAGPGKGGQTAGTVAGTSVFGAVAGGFAGGGSGALLGGVLGGLGGAGLSALSRGPQLFVPAESVLTFYLNAPLTVNEPTPGEIRASSSNIPPRYGYRRPAPYYPNYPNGYPRGYVPPPGAPPGGYPY